MDEKKINEMQKLLLSFVTEINKNLNKNKKYLTNIKKKDNNKTKNK